MKIAVCYFARCREAAGAEREELEVADGMTVALLREQLRGRGGGWAEAVKDPVRFAINHEFAGLDDVIRDNDEVAVFPPITGG